ncbi:MAG: hypothetical protein DRI57_21805 [Deltaproteobacteria bacterium]|nr:MAG: hypothetical protein DRI57_21805 [Deltaproteobacteria bacterium]
MRGICYYFEQDKASEKIVFCDNKNTHQKMKYPTMNYAPVSGVDIHAASSNVHSLCVVRSVCHRPWYSKIIIMKSPVWMSPAVLMWIKRTAWARCLCMGTILRPRGRGQTRKYPGRRDILDKRAVSRGWNGQPPESGLSL